MTVAAGPSTGPVAAPARADVALVAAGLFDSRAKAREAIAAGLVRADGRVVAKPSASLPAGARLEARAAHPWVSRGGTKLAAALDALGIFPEGLACLDVGASTGGFSHVLLSRGAAHVTAVDVGHGQLHPDLRRNSRLTLLEGRDARTLRPDDLPAPPGLLVFDLSFISLRLVLPRVLPLAARQAAAVALVKPQFEAGPARVGKGGVVREPAVWDEVCAAVAACVLEAGWRVIDIVPSPIAGGDGNREFLLGARRP